MPKEDNKMIQLTKIILKQKAHRTARIITYSGFEHRSIDIKNDLGWETLDQRHNKQLAVCVYHRLLSIKRRLPLPLHNEMLLLSKFIFYSKLFQCIFGFRVEESFAKEFNESESLTSKLSQQSTGKVS